MPRECSLWDPNAPRRTRVCSPPRQTALVAMAVVALFGLVSGWPEGAEGEERVKGGGGLERLKELV